MPGGDRSNQGRYRRSNLPSARTLWMFCGQAGTSRDCTGTDKGLLRSVRTVWRAPSDHRLERYSLGIPGVALVGLVLPCSRVLGLAARESGV